jgi:phosphatidylinositol alpha-1,6-mannosyltransferase
VCEGRTGHVVNGRDPDDLVAALVDVLADPDRAAEMGAAGRAWMQADWGWGDRAARLVALLAGMGAGMGSRRVEDADSPC